MHSPVVMLEMFNGFWVLLIVLQLKLFVSFDMSLCSMLLKSHITAQATDVFPLWWTVIQQNNKISKHFDFNMHTATSVCVIFLPVVKHKFTVSIFCLCPSHLLVQQIYFPASALLTFKMCIDLLEETSVSFFTAEFPRPRVLLASKVHLMEGNSPGHECVKLLPEVT